MISFFDDSQRPKSSNLAKPWGWEVIGSTSINSQKGTRTGIKYILKKNSIHNWQWNSMAFFFRPTRHPVFFFGPRFLFTAPWRTKRLLGSNRIFTQLPGDLQIPSKAQGAPTFFLSVLYLEGEGLPVPNKNTYCSPEKITWQWKDNPCDDVSPIKYWWFSIRFWGAKKVFPTIIWTLCNWDRCDILASFKDEVKWTSRHWKQEKRKTPLLYACHPRSSFS